MIGACGTHFKDERCIEFWSEKKPEVRRPLGITRRRWEDNTKWIVGK
jgi:hypothetical protein